MTAETQEARAERVHREAIIVDISVRGQAYQRLLEGGVTGSIVSVTGNKSEGIEDTITNIMQYIELVYAHPDQLTILKSPDEIRVAKESGKTGYIFHIQGMGAIAERLLWIEMLARLGVRLMAPTYNAGNAYGCGCGEKTDTGLTYLGRQAVRELNRAGVVIDLSHLGFRTARETLEISTDPVILSHSCPYDLVPNPRNAPADLMKAVAEKGGTMGISVYAPLLDPGTGQFPTVETVLEHIDYTVERLGIDHVAIGSDHSEITDLRWLFYTLRQSEAVPAYYLEPPYRGKARYHSVLGFETPADMPKITRGLVARGYSDEDIKKIMGGNLLRILDQIWGKRLKYESAGR